MATCSFIEGSFRIILFFGCLLSVLVQTGGVVALIRLSSDISDLQLPQTKFGLIDYVLNFSLLGLALIGCYGSFYKHHRSVRIFSILTGFSTTVIVLMALHSMSPEQVEKENMQFVERMRMLALKYSWEQKIEFGVSEADRAWNKLQTFFCCGLKGPEDWIKWRPNNIAYDAYPATCCPHAMLSLYDIDSSEPYCRQKYVYQMGCLEQVRRLEDVNLITTYFFVGFHLLLSVLSCVVAINLNQEKLADERCRLDKKPDAPPAYTEVPIETQLSYWPTTRI